MKSNKGKQYPNPKFSSVEEEDKYWETHSPLDEGFEGEVETSEQKRSSFLSVRMAGDELSQLRDAAAQIGLAPSTYVRLVLKEFIGRQNWPMRYPFDYLYNSNTEHESILKRPDICILNTNDINIDRAVINSMLDLIRSAWKCRIITPDDADYEKIEHLVKTQP